MTLSRALFSWSSWFSRCSRYSRFSWSGSIASALVLSALHILQAQTPAPGIAPASGVTAIVGARIIDGSGNTPFEGTVVVRGDRIAEVGRSVTPPDGARIVQAQGRTVMPALVDLGVTLPQGAADEEIARALAAYLYAGVTSIVPANLTPAEVGALRDRMLRTGLRGPRLAIASDPARLVRGAASGGTLADAQALTDWKQRNATYVPELALAAPADRRAPTPLLQEMSPGAAPGRADAGAGAPASGSAPAGGTAGRAGGAADPARWKRLLDQTRAARDAGVRLGVGSGAGAPSLAHGWGTPLAARLLVDAGVTSLQAVTAATSGGAWALSLQSDRGFLAVGQRADLLIVTGDPSTTIGDLERIERVFLGGDELDRAALRTLITRPAAAPPDTPDPTAAAAAETAARAKTPPFDPRTAAGRKALREARAARGKTGMTPPGTATGAAASSAEGTAAGTTTASGEPATTSPATSASGEPASGTSSSAAIGGAAIAASGAMLDDFENGDDSSTLGRTWTSAAESPNSSTTVVVGRVVKGQRDHALHVTARMGDAKDAHARVTLEVSRDGHPLDVSRFHGLRFDARGQGRYRVIFISRGVSDGRYHESYFSGSPNWTPVGIPFASIGQTGTTHRVRWTGRDLLEIVFLISRSPGDLGWLELDNIRFY